MKSRLAVKPQKTDQWRNRLGQLRELRDAERFREAEEMNQAMNDQHEIAKSRAIPSCDERMNDAQRRSPPVRRADRVHGPVS